MKVLVTGGTGFVGSHLVEALLRNNVEVFALIRDTKNLKWLQGLDIHLLQGDLFSIPSLPHDLDLVYHLAALSKATKEKDYYTVNHQGTASLFDSLERQKIKPAVVVMSSISAGGPSAEGRPIREDDPPHPVSSYGRSKLLAEDEALRRKTELPVVILRPGIIFGPRDQDMLVLFKIFKLGFVPRFRDGRIKASFCYVKDVARALLLFLRRPVPSGEIFNIAMADPPSFLEFSKTIGRLMGFSLRSLSLPVKAVGLAARLAEWSARLKGKRPTFNRSLFREMREVRWVVDVRKAAEQLGFRADTLLESALAETIQWYREQGWL